MTYSLIKYISANPLEKADFLLFDQVAVPELSEYLRHAPVIERAGMEWLHEAGCLVDAGIWKRPGDDVVSRVPGDLLLVSEIARFASRVYGLLPDQSHRALTPDIGLTILRGYYNHGLRAQALEHEQRSATFTVPFIIDRTKDIDISKPLNHQDLMRLADFLVECAEDPPTPHPFPWLNPDVARELRDDLLKERYEPAPLSTSVMSVLLRAFPTPAEDTPWEKIVEFAQDKDAARERNRLHRWLSEMQNEGRRTVEIVGELEHLLSTYEEHMRLHRMRIKPGVLESIVTVPAQVLEHVCRREFGKAASSLFGVRVRRAALLQEEINAPGREVAYISRLRNARF